MAEPTADPGDPDAERARLLEDDRAAHARVRRDLGAYGFDAPVAFSRAVWVTVGFLLALLVGAVVGSVPLMIAALFASFAAAATGLALVWSSRVGKLRERVRIVDALAPGPDDRVLDVGCGRGLLTIEVARRLGSGVAIGIDLWRDPDRSGTDPTRLWDNAAAEGVDDRVEIAVDDARLLAFPDASFDAVVSLSAIGALPDAGARAEVLAEAARVLRPGGRLVFVDARHTEALAETLRTWGWDVQRSKRSWGMFPPVRSVSATRPTR